ncbi:MAG: hypothetical protein UU25_C0002G0010 [Microgenomates group bacterium GW2011_GWB1_40_9]|nr:MAG: hypothetical protein UU25_C0002G0010 [Microgenomates group bacterium GW2011_GWB1_40_9]
MREGKMAKFNSKKYFFSAIKSVLSLRLLSKDPELIDLIATSLACFIPKSTQSISKRLKSKLLKSDFENRAFCEIVRLVANRTILNQNEIAYVLFLEQDGLSYVANWLEAIRNDCDWNCSEDVDGEILALLRKKSPNGILNACCYICGKALERHGNPIIEPHYCTRRENQECFSKRKLLSKKNDREWKFIHNQRCAHHLCNKPIDYSLNLSENHFHTNKFFCSIQHYEDYRKNIQRKKVILV